MSRLNLLPAVKDTGRLLRYTVENFRRIERVINGLDLSGGGGSDAISGAYAVPTSAPTFSAYTPTKVPLDTVIYDTHSYFDNANDRFIVPAGQGGLFQLNGTVGTTSSVTSMDVLFRVNGSSIDVRDRRHPGGSYSQAAISFPWVLNDGDYVELWGQFSGSVAIVSVYCKFAITRLGSV